MKIKLLSLIVLILLISFNFINTAGSNKNTEANFNIFKQEDDSIFVKCYIGNCEINAEETNNLIIDVKDIDKNINTCKTDELPDLEIILFKSWWHTDEYNGDWIFFYYIINNSGGNFSSENYIRISASVLIDTFPNNEELKMITDIKNWKHGQMRSLLFGEKVGFVPLPEFPKPNCLNLFYDCDNSIIESNEDNNVCSTSCTYDISIRGSVKAKEAGLFGKEIEIPIEKAEVICHNATFYYQDKYFLNGMRDITDENGNYFISFFPTDEPFSYQIKVKKSGYRIQTKMSEIIYQENDTTVVDFILIKKGESKFLNHLQFGFLEKIMLILRNFAKSP
jgi:hypothetical protein